MLNSRQTQKKESIIEQAILDNKDIGQILAELREEDARDLILRNMEDSPEPFLYWACMHGNKAAITILIKYGAHMDSRNVITNKNIYDLVKEAIFALPTLEERENVRANFMKMVALTYPTNNYEDANVRMMYKNLAEKPSDEIKQGFFDKVIANIISAIQYLSFKVVDIWRSVANFFMGGKSKVQPNDEQKDASKDPAPPDIITSENDPRLLDFANLECNDPALREAIIDNFEIREQDLRARINSALVNNAPNLPELAKKFEKEYNSLEKDWHDFLNANNEQKLLATCNNYLQHRSKNWLMSKFFSTPEDVSLDEIKNIIKFKHTL